MLSTESRYQIHEQPDGFLVEGDDRPPVVVRFHLTYLEAHFDAGSHPGQTEKFGFFNFGKLLEFVARGLLRTWEPSEGWFGVRAWAQQQTSRALARRLREHWLRLLRRADPTVLQVQRRIFAATFGDAPLTLCPELYTHRLLVDDILEFRACAMAVRNAWTLTRGLQSRRFHHSQELKAAKQLAEKLGLHLQLIATPPEEVSTASQLLALESWHALFSDTSDSYRCLNRTLVELPGRVPHRMVCNLRHFHLERPLLHRLELLVAVLYAGRRASREPGFPDMADHLHVFQNASEQKIRESIHRLSRHLRQPLDDRRSSDVRQFVQFLADYPDSHRGNILGLTEQAIRWHRDRQAEQIETMRLRHGDSTPTVMPPVPLPTAVGVRFLDCVGAICAEAQRMQHCVASYIDQAVHGGCYLFHIDHEGEEATVEVGTAGKVRQSQGPRNLPNRAAAWGKRLLNRWGKSFPFATSMPVPVIHCGDDDIPF
ncbi:MAG: PcfJ domain-containing protein [Gemmataceae bacterium]